MHQPLLKWFPLFIWLLFAGLIRVVSSVVLWGGAGAAFPRLRCSGSRLFYMERALRCAQFQPSGVPQKRGTKSCACFLCLPSLSGSGCQELDRRTLPRCGAPSPLRDPSLSFRLCQSGVYAFCPLLTQPQSLPALVGCLRPVVGVQVFFSI